MRPVHVLTNRYDNTRTGVNAFERRLNVGNVNTEAFGKLFTRPVDGDLYAQPLLVSGMAIGGTTCNVVFLATTRNSVYAYEADDPDACLPLWSRNLGAPMPRDDVFKKLNSDHHYMNFGSEIGITSTPAIALREGGGILYVVAKTRCVTSLGGGLKISYSQKIHALDLATGQDAAIPNNPAEIRACARKADGSTIDFDPLFQLNRPGLLLHDGILYLAFGSHTDVGVFYGWILAYDAATLTQRAAYCTAPDWGEGGIWQSGCGLAADDDGFVYAVVGNGVGPSKHVNDGQIPNVTVEGGIDRPVYGNCILKLKLTPTPEGGEALTVKDWYTVPDVMDLNETDNDLTAGPVVFEAPGEGDQPRKLVFGGGKDGRFYVLDRTDMGHWEPLTGGTPSHWVDPQSKGDHPGEDQGHGHGRGHGHGPDHNTGWIPWTDGTRPHNVVQDDRLCKFHIHGAPVIWTRQTQAGTALTAYVWSEKDALRAFPFRNGRFDTDPSPTRVSEYCFPDDEMRMPGGFLTLSSDGDRDGTAIVWASHPTDDDAMNKTVKGTLRAYDARDINKDLWNSDQDAYGGDHLGFFAKFNPPVVANGKVYLATFSRELAVYGLFADVGRTRPIEVAGMFELRRFGKQVDGRCPTTGGRYELSGSGLGLRDVADSFIFAYRTIDLLEEPRVQVTAQLYGINTLPAGTNIPGARVGIMIRKFGEKVEESSYVALVVTAGQNGKREDNDLLLQSRDKAGKRSRARTLSKRTLPLWLRLTCEPDRRTFQFRAEVSKDGATWETVGQAPIAMNGRVIVGLVATAQIDDDEEAKNRGNPPQVAGRFVDVRIDPQT